MTEAHMQRKLAAILAADVVGYSRMMGADEAGTLAALKRHRETVFDPAVAAHNGRIVKLIGDGTHGGVRQRGRCGALRACHAALGAIRRTQPLRSPSIVLRIGINLGDVIIDGDDIYGDGVNIAARLEPLAEPGGICVSSIVNESVGKRVDVRFHDGGEITVKNIDRPIRIWNWQPGAEPASPKPSRKPRARPATTASIAVLPFANMSGDPEQEYFSDGITEDIITDLSKIAGLTVIARNSSFAYKGRDVDIRAVGRELGVQIGAGRLHPPRRQPRAHHRAADRCGTGAHLWAERYDRDLTDIFAVQDEVTRRDRGRAQGHAEPGRKGAARDSGTAQRRGLRLVAARPRVHARQAEEPRDVRAGERSS